MEMAATDRSPLAGAMRTYLAKHYPELGAAGSVGVRPEALQVAARESDIPENAFRIAATVSGILPTGGSWINELDVGSDKVFQVMHEAPDLKVGAGVFLWVKPKALHVFDTNGNRLAAAEDLLRPAKIN
jgi:iron(III) transport system ATP-binding protein